jgi:phage terminase small subunit
MPAGGTNAPDLTSTSLNPRQRLFVVEYLKDKNATQAAIRAGYSEATARQMGSENLSKPYIAAEIDRHEAELLAKVQADTGITLARTLEFIAKSAYHDPRKFYDAKGNLKPIPELDDDTAFALAGFEVTEIGGRGKDAVLAHVSKVKLSERKGYLDMLMKHLGGYKADNAQQGDAMGTALRGFFADLHGGAGRIQHARDPA